MSLFENGHRFALAIRRTPAAGENLPVVDIPMSGPAGRYIAVKGKVDTGAFRTILNFDTADALGIGDPTSSPLETRTARTATDEVFPYYVHPISVRFAGDSGEPIAFLLEAPFADRVKRNLFGLDWLEHLCLAVDRQAVHFLKD